MRRQPETDDRGEVTSTVLVTTVAITLIMLAVQTSLVWHARSVVAAAASDGARAAQAEGGSTQAGQDAAARILASSSGLLPSPDVDVDRSGGVVAVSVEADVVSLLPFWRPRVSASAGGPVERFRSEADR